MNTANSINIMEDLRLPEQTPSIIKVIGVGGGGGNAVRHMYNQGIEDVNFLICNTDRQALEGNPVPAKIQLGTEGLGAGNKPEKAALLAEQSKIKIQQALSDGTRMVFVTAGMGGGTGTGAAPVVAQVAKDMGILTVGIVTIPYLFEGRPKIMQAFEGLLRIRKHVDALLVINNELLHKVYTNITFKNAFAKADDTLLTAARSISNVITHQGEINVDFADVETTLRDSGSAIISVGSGEGEGRLDSAFKDAFNSPLISNQSTYQARRILFYITYGNDPELYLDEAQSLNEIMEQFQSEFSLIWGHGEDSELGGKVKVTLLAAGTDDIQTDDPDALYDIYYGDLDTNKPITPFIFSDDNLTNESVISLVENTPTYLRSKQTLESIQNAARY